MAASGLLDFFILEAGDYLERLDALVAHAGQGVPSAAELLTEARALRGAAIMAKQEPIATVAAGLVRLTKALHDEQLPWDAALRGTTISTIDDLKILVRRVRTWSADDDLRATRRADELAAVVPAADRPSVAARTPVALPVLAYIASEISACAQALAGAAAADWQRAAPRLRALRGMAALQDLPPVGDIVGTADDRLAVLDRAGRDATAAETSVMHAAAVALEEAAAALHRGERPPTDSPALRELARTAEAVVSNQSVQERVVPITALFHADAGPHVVTEADAPPTTLSQRFRMEVITPAEHLRRVVADARRAAHGPARGPALAALRRATDELIELATSFSEAAVARPLQALATRLDTLDDDTLTALDATGAVLADPSQPMPLVERLRRVSEERLVPIESLAPDAPAAATPQGIPQAGAALHALLSSGIAGLTGLDAQPLSPPAVVEEELIGIDELLYRGRAALDRAIAIRDVIQGSKAPAPADQLEELFALLDLARTD
jgi:chemotaxis protein histidine kinase CheA